MKITVLGGSGLIGSKLVSLLRQEGHDVVAASLESGLNTITGAGLDEALRNAKKLGIQHQCWTDGDARGNRNPAFDFHRRLATRGAVAAPLAGFECLVLGTLTP